ncbi:uncharacterized protein LOC125040716 [Penaeus chinensis]|uniref:uncharacterized protein LOC125040716 n=1 Tax=Penaeus chinensis TaxID=139456 RepID=UPI001FB59FFF|nr:uncharacterized protein LOC125040716 [Penaeus chinensis]
MPFLQLPQTDDCTSQMPGRLRARDPWSTPSCRRAASQSAAAAMRGARQVLRGALFLAAILMMARAARARATRPRFRSPTLQPIKSGIDAMSAALWGRQNSCQKNAASSEEKLARIKYVVDSQWEMLGKADEKVKAMEEKMEELVAIKQDYAEATPDPEECSYPFKMEAHGCFWLHKNPGLPWEAARRRCQQSGSDLATPSSLAQMREFLLREIGREWWYVWIGGQMTGYRTWVYVNGREGAANPEDWHDTLNPGSCTALNGGRDYKMMAWHCEDANWFLCQKF